MERRSPRAKAAPAAAPEPAPRTAAASKRTTKRGSPKVKARKSPAKSPADPGPAEAVDRAPKVQSKRGAVATAKKKRGGSRPRLSEPSPAADTAKEEPAAETPPAKKKKKKGGRPPRRAEPSPAEAKDTKPSAAGSKRKRAGAKVEVAAVEGGQLDGGLPRAKREKPAPSTSKGKADKTSTTPNREKEATLWAQGLARVAGVDEAGRGPLAGPVVAAACVLPADADAALLDGIRDSKLMNEAQREEVFERLVNAAGVDYAVSILDHKRIDEINILASTMEAMSLAVKGLSSKPDYVLIDGNRCPPDLGIPAEAVVKGDLKCTNIAAASIIAKVTRDRMMHAYHKRWPQYDFATHKGYGTAKHMAAIHREGPCPIHRRTFAPLKHMDLISENEF